MNYIRKKGKHVSLASIDIERNKEDYLHFKKMLGKNEFESHDTLNDLGTKNFLAIIENGTGILVGVVGLENIIYANQRANINLDLSTIIDEEKKRVYGSEAINLLTEYAYDTLNLHSILAEVPNYEKDILSAYQSKDSGFEYIGTRSFACKENNELHGLCLFDTTPEKFAHKKEIEVKPSKILVLDNKLINTYYAFKTKLSSHIEGEKISLIRPSTIMFSEDEIIKLGEALNDKNLASAMGQYKTVYNDYRVNKMYNTDNSVDYVIVTKTGKVIGYVNRLHSDVDNLKTDIEIMIYDEESKGKRIGEEVINLFVNELRRMGYISIGGVVFNFNSASNKMCERIGFNKYATRKESYFAHGVLNDMNYYEVSTDNFIDSQKVLEIKDDNSYKMERKSN